LSNVEEKFLQSDSFIISGEFSILSDGIKKNNV